jgi:hypothetical protein
MDSPTLWRWLANSALVLCAAVVLAFAGDFLVLHVRIAARGLDSATAKLNTYAAAPLKDGKFDVYFDQPQTQTCVRSLFPWLGYQPCWYLQRHPITVVY